MLAKRRMSTIVAVTAAFSIAGSGMSFADQVDMDPQSIHALAGASTSFTVQLDSTDPQDEVAGCNASVAEPVRIDFTSHDAWAVPSQTSVSLTDCVTVTTIHVAIQAGTPASSATKVDGVATGGRQDVAKVIKVKGDDVTTYIDSTYSTDFVNVHVDAPAEPTDPCAGVASPAAPVVAFNPAEPDGTVPWYVSIPTVSATSTTADATISYATDGVTFSAAAPTLGEGVTTVTAKATSATCDRTSTGTGTVSVDTIAPVITGSTNGYTPGTWTAGPVVVTFTCTDAAGGSGIDSNTVAGATVSASGADQSVTNTGDCTDAAGNSATAVTVSDIDVDADAPLLNISGPADGASFDVCSKPDRPSFAPSDALSGLDGTEEDSWTVPTSASGVGTYEYSAHATDNVGNESDETRTYHVNYGASVTPFLQPINLDGTSRFRLGSTIPVKFKATCNGAPVTNVTARMYVGIGDSSPDPGVDEAVSTSAATTGNLFRYDATAGQYIFNLSTKSGYVNPGQTAATAFTPGSWTFKIGLDDGTFRSVKVQLVK